MTIRFSCPACNRNLKAPDDAAGRRVACPGCKRPLAVPEEPPLLEALPVEEEAAPPPAEATVELDDGTGRDGWVGFVCPGCKNQLLAPAADARAKAVCPACRHVTTVPTTMHLRPAGDRQQPGMAYNDCPRCKARLEVREEELGGTGPCPACRTRVVFARPGVLEKNTGRPQPDRINFSHAPCGTELCCDRAEAGTYSNCPACGQTCRVPRWAAITRDDRKRHADRVYWRCAGCSTDVQSEVRYEEAIGVCPGCNDTMKVPRRGRTERDAGGPTEGWVSAACRGCKARFRFPLADAGAVAVCPGCGNTIQLPASPQGPAPLLPAGGGRRPQPTHEARVETAATPPLPGYVHFACVSCGTELRASASDGGARGRCPGCSRAVLVPWHLAVRVAGGQAAAGTAYAACPHCGVHVEARREELGGTGLCPACGKNVILYRGGLVRPDGGKPGPALVRFACGCGAGLEADFGDAARVGPCPACQVLVQVPRRCVVERRNWLARPNAVTWACFGCRAKLQSPSDEFEGDWGECPDCGRPNRVPHRPGFLEKVRRDWDTGWRLGRALGDAAADAIKGMALLAAAAAVDGGVPGMVATPSPVPEPPKPPPPLPPAARQGTPPSQPAQPPKPASQQPPAATPRRVAVAVEGAVIIEQDDWSVTYQKKCDKCGRLEPGTTRTSRTNLGGSLTTVFKCFGCGNQQRFTIRGG